MRLILSLLLLCFISIDASAQDPTPSPTPSPTPEKPTVTYDRFKDATSVVMKHVQVSGTGLDGLELGLIAGYAGSSPKGPVKDVLFSLTSTSKDWQYLRYTPMLLAIVDGKRTPIGTPVRGSGHVGRSYVMEWLYLSLPPSVIAKLANAKKVEMQFGAIEFELTSSQQANMREFLKALQP